MEIVHGRITNVQPDGITIFVPYRNIERLCTRRYEEVEVGMMDGRNITPEQRRKAYALLGEIVAWSGMDIDEVKLTTKHEFIAHHLEGLQKQLFSLSNCDVTTARQYITYLIEFIMEFDVPCNRPLVDLCDDIERYVYQCLMHKRCAVCGSPADLHHVDRVGMGGDRKHMSHIGLRALPLCRMHHQEAHSIGDEKFCEQYHLVSIQIDEQIAKKHKLKGNSND